MLRTTLVWRVFTPISRNFTSRSFLERHLGNDEKTINKIYQRIDIKRGDLLDKALPSNIRYTPLETKDLLDLPSVSEHEALMQIRQIAKKNHSDAISMIGQGYYNTYTPNVILRNLIENPSWYTPYTPYQSEIAQGRLESLFNFQTMVSDLTGLPRTNSSLLDEASAAAESLTLSYFKAQKKIKKMLSEEKGLLQVYLADSNLHPQTLEVLKGRAEALNVHLMIVDVTKQIDNVLPFGMMIQYPNTRGYVESVENIRLLIGRYRERNTNENNLPFTVSMATDLLALTLLTPPGELGVDVAFGSTQRFGVPLGGGGPHAAFFATTEDNLRSIPGRIIGLTKDSQGNPAYRMSLQTREQHIKKDKATSNICTAQALLANVAANYAVYHGPEGLRTIAKRIQDLTREANEMLPNLNSVAFDTLLYKTDDPDHVLKSIYQDLGINIRKVDENHISFSIDETTTSSIIKKLTNYLKNFVVVSSNKLTEPYIFNSKFQTRSSSFLTHPIFNSHHSETQMMRYLYYLEKKDLGLNTSMIPLGSCTMKLNSTSEMIAITWPEFANLHPYAPSKQLEGYYQLTQELREWLSKITGFADVSLQPNSGALGEYTGLRVIAAYHSSHAEIQRRICLIPDSAHGTNPASAVLAGYKVVTIKSDKYGNVNLEDLQNKISNYRDQIGALMITYPSTYGVFESQVQEICDLVHEAGGQVYMDGANLNAQLGFTSPGKIGADVCHLNLHKTFCIPHGGGGPGSGPIGVAKHLVKFLPKNPNQLNSSGIYPVIGTQWGNPMVLPIPYQYIKMLGKSGLMTVTEHAILNANYMMKKLKKYYPIVYTNQEGCCAHEFILDAREFKKELNITSVDIAKRLQDYGFHAPTNSWPVNNTLMIEPTECEDKEEMDRYCDALIAIKLEIDDIRMQLCKEKNQDILEDNLLKNAPHTLEMVTKNEWSHSYTREKAAFPKSYLRKNKHWPTVGRTDEIYGDRNLVTKHPLKTE